MKLFDSVPQWFKYLFVFASFFGTAFCQNFLSLSSKVEFVTLTLSDSVYTLQNTPLIANSEVVSVDTLIFQRDLDYKIDYSTGVIYFPGIKEKQTFRIYYQFIPPELSKKTYYYQEQTFQDTTQTVITIPRRRDYWEGNQINISGSKTFSISVANNEDVRLDQSLFLQLDGEISKNVFVEAQITDSQSPITPEGDSRELSSLDQIMIRVYGKQYDISFGNLEMKLTGNYFLNYTPQFEGVKFLWDGKQKARMALAISKGKSTTFTFSGQDGKLGPYYLTESIAKGVLIIPGSEIIYLDGQLIERGDDYTIDYSEGTVTFKNRDISSDSYIMATFQYSDENYRQNLYMLGGDLSLGDKFYLNQNLFYQIDDKDNPLSGGYSDDDKLAIQQAGDSAVLVSGITETEAGEGDYVLNSSGYYEYAPGDSTANFILNFVYVGSGNGDYSRESFARYNYVGESLGDWILAREIIPPQSRLNYDIAAGYHSDLIQLEHETLITYLDLNTMSSLNDGNNIGFAFHNGVTFTPDYDNFMPELTVSQRFFSRDIRPVTEIRDATEFYETNFINEPDSLEKHEYFASLKLSVYEFMFPKFSYKNRILKDYAESNSMNAELNFEQKAFSPSIREDFSINRQNYKSSPIKTDEIINNNIEVSYLISMIRPGFSSLYRQFLQKNTDDSETGSKLFEKTIFLSLEKMKKISARFSYSYQDNFDKIGRKNKSSDNWEKSKETIIWKASTLYSSGMNVFSVNYTRTDIDGRTDEEDNRFDRAEISSNHSLFDNSVSLSNYYELKNIEFYPKVRELQYVGESAGQYDSTGVFLENGGWDWVMTTLGESEMTIEVNADFSLFLKPGFLVKNKESHFLKKIQSETRINVSENSRTGNKYKIYFLQPEYLMNKQSTIFGRQYLKHIFWFDLLKNELLAETSYSSDVTMDNRYQTDEKNRRSLAEIGLKILSARNFKYELRYENSNEKNSHYNSVINNKMYTGEAKYSWQNQIINNTKISYSSEDGQREDQTRNYKLIRWGIANSTTLFMVKNYRFFIE
ncbi:MAG: hypothetical protein PHR06_10205, partial [Candidatus Cloacimonetes bacterium]|nr:hypothetical protein [Candidatus Cloacimonadota bacterium]